MTRLRQSFLASQKLWDHMQFLLEHGSMYLVRDDHLIFHGCVPVDDKGEFLPLEVDGKPRAGKALFDALDDVLARVARPADRPRPRPDVVSVVRPALAAVRQGPHHDAGERPDRGRRRRTSRRRTRISR